MTPFPAHMAGSQSVLAVSGYCLYITTRYLSVDPPSEQQQHLQIAMNEHGLSSDNKIYSAISMWSPKHTPQYHNITRHAPIEILRYDF
jgi:hypothetical protein